MTWLVLVPMLELGEPPGSPARKYWHSVHFNFGSYNVGRPLAPFLLLSSSFLSFIIFCTAAAAPAHLPTLAAARPPLPCYCL